MLKAFVKSRKTSHVYWSLSEKILLSRNRTPYRPSVRTTGQPLLNLTRSSWCGSLQPDFAHPCCGRLTAVKTGYPLTSITWPYRGLRCRPIFFRVFWVIRWQNTSFQMIAGSSSIFLNAQEISCLSTALLKFWFQTDFRREKSTGFFTGREDSCFWLFSPWWRVGHATLSSCSQIFEKLVYKQLTNYIEKYNILTESQFGFRKGHSTEQAITDITENFRKSIDNQFFLAMGLRFRALHARVQLL